MSRCACGRTWLGGAAVLLLVVAVPWAPWTIDTDGGPPPLDGNPPRGAGRRDDRRVVRAHEGGLRAEEGAVVARSPPGRQDLGLADTAAARDAPAQASPTGCAKAGDASGVYEAEPQATRGSPFCKKNYGATT